MQVELGHRIQCKVTGFEGTVIGIVDYITGCKQILVQPKAKDGTWIDSHWIDVDRATVLDFGSKLILDVVTNGSDKQAPCK